MAPSDSMLTLGPDKHSGTISYEPLTPTLTLTLALALALALTQAVTLTPLIP